VVLRGGAARIDRRRGGQRAEGNHPSGRTILPRRPRPAYRDVVLRATWQANSKTKIAAFFQRMFKNKGTEPVADRTAHSAEPVRQRGSYAVGSGAHRRDQS
jgi:hypothetical protein